MKTGQAIATVLLSALPGFAILAQESIEPTWSLRTEIGGGYLSDSSFKFGDYTGLNEHGGFFVGDLIAEYTTVDDYWRFEGLNLGLASRSITLNGGQPDLYELRLSYDKLPHYLFESGATPFLNPGSASLRLPSDWTPGATTSRMPNLDQSLQSVAIRSDRETINIGFSFIQNERVEYDLAHRYSSKHGTGTHGSSFLNTASILPRPIDYETQTLEAGVTYRGASWSGRLGYFGSLFSNDTPTLQWDNPFTPGLPGTDTGQTALEPDNEFHQLVLSGQYKLLPNTQLSGNLALGRMEQDEDLLPFTINPNIVSPLPSPSVSTAVDTLHLNLRVASRPTRKLRLRATYTVDERDNDTASLEWAYVASDSLLATPRTNLPYDYERAKLTLNADFRLPRGVKALGGWTRAIEDRTFTEVGRSEEDELWSKLKLSIGDRADLSLYYTSANRDISDYRAVAATQPPQNPLLRKYNLADREREGFRLGANLRPVDGIDLNLMIESMQDDYDRSLLGLVAAKYKSIYVDTGLALPSKASLTAYLGYEQYHSEQIGSQAFSQPDWRAAHKDETISGGFVLSFPEWIDRVDLRIGYNYMATMGEIQTNTSGLSDRFPDLVTRRHRLEINADYRWRKDITLRMGWIFEDYKVDDWSLDGVNANTLSRVLGLGNQWLGYEVNAVMLSINYSKFRK